MPRTLDLTERTTTRCRLSPAVVAHLLQRHRNHLTLLPTGERHGYRVTPLGRVGTLEVPGLRVVIRPKIPLRNVFYLLDPAAPLPAVTAGEPGGEDVLGFLALRLAEQVRVRVQAGLHRGYRERAARGVYLQGRLDLPAQVRDARREQLHYHQDEYATDVPCNQAPLAAATALLECPHLGDPARATLRQAVVGLAGVTSLPLEVALVERAEAGRPPEEYRPLLGTCRVLAESLVRGEAPAFLLDLERLFERYVSRGVADAFAGVLPWSVRAQQSYPLAEPQPAAPGLLIRPDVALEREGGVGLVLDVKWKRLGREALPTDDVYQVTSYCAALRAGRGVLVYPGRRECCWEYALGAVQLAVRTLNVAGEPDRCRRGLERLGRWLLRQTQQIE